MREMSQEKEIKFLKNVVAAQARYIIAYRLGVPKMPEWVLTMLRKAKDRYGDDLRKLKSN